MNDDELEEHWEKILASEGLPAEPQPRYLRATKPDENGVRPWLGRREVDGHTIDERSQDRSNTPRPENQWEAMMAEPHQPVDEYPADKLLELREALLDAVEQTLTPTEAELVVSVVLGDDSYASVGARLGLPHSTAWWTAHRALEKLQEPLAALPEVADYLRRHNIEDAG